MTYPGRMLLAGLLLATGAAHALDFKSIGAAPAVLYDAPSGKGLKSFIAPRGMPVEVILNYGEWTKIRDASGELFWLETKALSAARTVVVIAPSVKVRSSADDSSGTAFAADKGVLLELVEPASSGWIKVRHRDGQGGYVKAAEVWGE